MKYAVILVLVVGLLVAASPALAQEISLFSNINPMHGGPGTEVTVSGSGAWPNQNVIVSLAPQAESNAGALVTLEVTPNTDGTFSTILTIPEEEISPGVYFVRTEQANPERFISQYYWNTVRVGTLMLPAVAAETEMPVVIVGEAPAELPVTGGAAATPSRVIVLLGLVLVAVGLVGRGLYAILTAK
jgi:hypothetical protein